MKSSFVCILLLSSVATAQRTAAPAPAPFTVVEASIADLKAALESKRLREHRIEIL